MSFKQSSLIIGLLIGSTIFGAEDELFSSSPDGKLVARVGTGGQVIIADKTGKKIGGYNYKGGVSSIHFSLDSKFIAIVGTNGQVIIADKTGKNIGGYKHKGGACVTEVYSISFSPDRKFIESVGPGIIADKTGQEIDGYNYEGAEAVYFSSKGKFIETERGDSTKVKSMDLASLLVLYSKISDDQKKKKRLYDIALKAAASKLTKSDRQYIKLNLDHSNKKQFFQIIQDKLMKLKEEHKPLQGTVAGIIPGCEYNLLNQIYTNAQRTYQRKSCDNS